jgi:hypothetical protein
MPLAVQMGILLEVFGLRLHQVEVRNVRWRTAILDMVFLTVLEIIRLSVEGRVCKHLPYQKHKVITVPNVIRLAFVLL